MPVRNWSLTLSQLAIFFEGEARQALRGVTYVTNCG